MENRKAFPEAMAVESNYLWRGSDVAHYQPGMTLREYLIGQAITGAALSDRNTALSDRDTALVVARRACSVADAVLAVMDHPVSESLRRNGLRKKGIVDANP